VTSSATLDDHGLQVRLDWRGMVFGLSRREFSIVRADIISVRTAKTKDASRMLRYRVGGTAVPGWWLMGWFTRATRDGRWAWVWITPKRELIAIETTHKRRSLVIIPRDWFASAPLLFGGEDAAASS
jgi:hypothetical protein